MTNIATYLNEGKQSFYCGLSIEDKPIDVMDGALFREIDTSEEYRYDVKKEQWFKQKNNRGWEEW